MIMGDEREQEVLSQWREERIMTLARLQELLGCSRATVQRRLGRWQCYTSINGNGGYYALPAVVDFDEFGLWHHDGICFSAHGNLNETVIHLVESAEAGLTVGELSRQLQMNAHSFIWGFSKRGLLSREKCLGRFVYMGVDTPLRERQQRCRRALSEQALSLTDADAIAVLVELVRHPQLDAQQLSERLRARAPTASAEAIQSMFNKHGLTTAKKGAPNLPLPS